MCMRVDYQNSSLPSGRGHTFLEEEIFNKRGDRKSSFPNDLYTLRNLDYLRYINGYPYMKCMYIDSYGTSLHRLGHFHHMAYLPILQRILAISAIVFLIRRCIRYLINWANGEMERLDDQIAESEGMTISKKNVDGSKAGEMKNPLVVSFGEMLIDFVPDVAGLSLAESLGFIKAPGGAPANVAVAIAKLGGRSAFIGKFGGDEFGHMLVDILKKNGVNGDGVCFDPDARTALAFVTLKSNREQEFMFYRNPSADMLLKESELNLDLIRQAKIFHYGSISLITDPCRSAHLAAMRAANAAGVLLSYDPNVRLSLWPSADAAREGIKSIWTEADFIKVSDDEVAFLTNGDPEKEEVVLSLWFDGPKLLVVTDGEKGCRYFTKEFKGKVDGFSVETVDTTGAGDAFVGSLLVSLARDDSLYKDEVKLREALKLANACGAISTTQKGAIPALPNTSMVQELVAKSK